MNLELLKQKIRPVIETDTYLPIFSHSRLECFENCPRKYFYQYMKKMSSDESSISLEFGTLLHRVLEEKGRTLNNLDHNKLNNILYDGVESEEILGINDLKKKYWEVWDNKDSEGRNYNDKLDIFLNVLNKEMEQETIWEPYRFEQYFEFVYDNKVIFRGFIDRIDKNEDGHFRVIDYKTSKKTYEQKKLSTSQQFALYAMAILLEFNELPIEYLYKFICLDEQQTALTIGWESRIIKKLDKILEKIDKMTKEDSFSPKPSPLCAFCSFSRTNPNAKKYRYECEYYSNWTPNDRKNFSVNKKWAGDEINKRKLIF